MSTNGSRGRPRSKGAKPKKPYPEFPLTVNGNGKYSKVINGVTYYFGYWDDPEGALRQYNAERPSILAGDRVRHDTDGNPIIVEESLATVVNRFLEFKAGRRDAGEIGDKQWNDYRVLGKRIVDFFGRRKRVEHLRPEDFERFRLDRAKTLGPAALKREVTSTKTIFNFAYQMGLVEKPVRFGPAFKGPSSTTIRRHKAQKIEREGDRMFQRDEILALLGATPRTKNPEAWRVMILLGINCGFGNTDCQRVRPHHFKDGVVEMARNKTGNPRRCPLWQETLDAIEAYLEAKPKPSDKAAAEAFLINSKGNIWTPHALCSRFTKMSKWVDAYNKDRGFYGLRHSFRTIGAETRDTEAVDWIMGHGDSKISSIYTETVDDGRLRAVTEHVRNWLFDGEGDNGE